MLHVGWVSDCLGSFMDWESEPKLAKVRFDTPLQPNYRLALFNNQVRCRADRFFALYGMRV